MNKKWLILTALLALVLSTLACGASAPAGVSNIYMANDENGENQTTTFVPTDAIYVFFDVNQVNDGAQFEIKWYALNVEGQDASTPFTTSEYTYAGEDTLYANIESTDPGGFPAAQYKVEIYMNSVKVGEQQFSVQ